jgi:hypothetical protein
MLRRWRWAVVLVGVAVLALLPGVVGAAPVPPSAASASALLARILRSGAVPHSGYAESTGGLALPVSGQLNSLTELLGGHTQQRVWWRGAHDWRIDTVTATGEKDTHEDAQGRTTWDYESNRVSVLEGPSPRVRLPTTSDLLPSELGRRLLGGATPAEVMALPSRRVAGRPADGLRLRPSASQTSIDRVDLWADRVTAIPLRVELFAKGDDRAAMAATFLDFASAVPAKAETAFSAPVGARIQVARQFDFVRFVDLLSGVTLPHRLGFATRTDTALGSGSIGVYGRGVTQFVVLQLPDRTATSLRSQLDPAGSADPERRVTMHIGPLGLVLTAPDPYGRTWLLAGTVTTAGLAQAADELTSRQVAAG